MEESQGKFNVKVVRRETETDLPTVNVSEVRQQGTTEGVALGLTIAMVIGVIAIILFAVSR